MMGYKYVFLRNNMDKYLKIIPITILIWRTAANSSRKYPTSHRLLHKRAIKPIITKGVFCIVENISL